MSLVLLVNYSLLLVNLGLTFHIDKILIKRKVCITNSTTFKEFNFWYIPAKI